MLPYSCFRPKRPVQIPAPESATARGNYTPWTMLSPFPAVDFPLLYLNHRDTTVPRILSLGHSTPRAHNPRAV